MAARQAALGVVLSVILVACGAGAEPTPSDPVGGATPEATSSPAVVTPSPATDLGTPGPIPAATPKPKPTPKPTPTPKPVPSKPTGVKFRARMRCVTDSCRRYKHTQTVTWTAPVTKGVEIRVYGVTECLAGPAHPKPGDGGPCLVKHTPLPASVRTLLATAPASAGKVTWSWIEGDPGCQLSYPVGRAPDGQEYLAVVVAAYSASGHSIFAIAEPGAWSEPDWESGDMIC